MNFSRMILVAAGATLLVALRLPAEESKEFQRYQVIVDRSPFGAVTAAGAATPVPGFATRFQFAGLVSSNNGPVQAIIYDKESKRSYFCVAGENLPLDGDLVGVKVETIDLPPSAKVVLRRGLEPATLRFEEKAGAPMAPTPGAMPPGQPPTPGDARRIPFRRTTQ